MKVNFIRKPTKRELVPQDEFVIEKVVEIPHNLFTCFINDPLNDYDFIKDNVESMWIDENERWHCILVKAEGYDFGILVESEGSHYARYAAFIPLLVFDERGGANGN